MPTKECISSHWLFIWQSQLFCLHYKIVSSTNGSKPVSETTLFNASLVASCWMIVLPWTNILWSNQQGIYIALCINTFSGLNCILDFVLSIICIGYSTIETKGADRIGYNGFLFTAWVLTFRWNPLYPIRANSFVSIIMYLTCTIIVLLKQIYGMAYIVTLLMFRKPNKTTINKNKRTNFYRSTSFRFSFIFRYFKVFQVSQIFTCGLSDLLLVVFVLKINMVWIN